ncbi:MAG: VOC family protein [Chloroflexota bacterium]
MIQKAGYLGIVVNDLESATAFYRDTLGVAVDETESAPGEFTVFNLDGGTVLALQAGTEIPSDQGFEPAVVVDDADATYALWKSRGAEMLDEPRDLPFGRAFMLKTPEGHVLRVYQA